MRHGTSSRRSRSRSSGNRKTTQPRNQVYDSNGPDVRIRGTAYQVLEKYMNLAKDAHSSGDKVLYESYLQHAEHYQRIISSWEEDISDSPDQSEMFSENYLFETRSNQSGQKQENSKNDAQRELVTA